MFLDCKLIINTPQDMKTDYGGNDLADEIGMKVKVC